MAQAAQPQPDHQQHLAAQRARHRRLLQTVAHRRQPATGAFHHYRLGAGRQPVERRQQRRQRHHDAGIVPVTYRAVVNPAVPGPLTIRFEGGEVTIGSDDVAHTYDNERPRHRLTVPAFRIDVAPVRNAEYLEFMNDGGYRRPELWLSDGWTTVQERPWKTPLYWSESRELWDQQLAGLVMWIPGGTVYLAAAAWAGYRWLAQQPARHDKRAAGRHGTQVPTP